MYTEERKGNFIKEFIAKLILVIIFVLLLMWLVPWPNMDSYTNALNPLKAQIFNANLQTMKVAAITYYTEERLPENVGDIKTLTLQQMLDLKLLIPFVDKNGDACDVKASYVSLEKMDTEYLLKVNLKCGDVENYILVHLGCYAYCQDYLCEKIPGKKDIAVKPKPTATPKPPVVTPKPQTPRPPTPRPQTPTPPTPTPTPNVEREYEYRLTTPAACLNWSNWVNRVVATGQTVTEVNTIYRQVQDLGLQNVKIGTQAAIYKNVQIVKDVTVQVGTLNLRVCTAYSYVVSGGTLHKVNGDWSWTNNYYRGFNPPADTISSRWIFQGVDWNACGSNCTNNPFVIYRQQVRNVQATSEPTTVTATCTKIENRSIPIFGNQTHSSLQQVLHTPARDIYGNVHFMRERTCTNVRDASTRFVWSHHNDTSLLNQGFTYTGRTRNK